MGRRSPKASKRPTYKLADVSDGEEETASRQTIQTVKEIPLDQLNAKIKLWFKANENPLNRSDHLDEFDRILVAISMLQMNGKIQSNQN